MLYAARPDRLERNVERTFLSWRHAPNSNGNLTSIAGKEVRLFLSYPHLLHCTDGEETKRDNVRGFIRALPVCGVGAHHLVLIMVSAAGFTAIPRSARAEVLLLRRSP